MFRGWGSLTLDWGFEGPRFVSSLSPYRARMAMIPGVIGRRAAAAVAERANGRLDRAGANRQGVVLVRLLGGRVRVMAYDRRR